jgi:acetyl esterase/lipase
MYMRKLIMPALLFMFCMSASAQKVITLYKGKAPGSESWNWPEKEYYHEMTKQRLVYNVADPTLTVFTPPAGTANGTAVIIAPGGGFHFLAIDREGTEVAQWLNKKGITAFVLKYRLVKSLTTDPFMEMMQMINAPGKGDSLMASLVPMSISDGQEAIRYVRTHAAEWGIDPRRIGFMGFSAGGTVTTGVTLNYTPESRPDFSAPIYAYTGGKPVVVPKDAPPMFILAASDDELKLGPHSVQLYNDWINAGKPVELHMYAKGGHGFGMGKQNLPSDTWIERFVEWMDQQGFTKTGKK